MKSLRKAGTRGSGILEGFLAKQRRAVAGRLIPAGARAGRILDIGCGAHPLFLLNTEFAHRSGLDRLVEGGCTIQAEGGPVRIIDHDLETSTRLPFDDGQFSVVTMLAVFEHVDPARVPELLREVLRVLRPGGAFILTTPAQWTDALLRCMAAVRLVSPEEIREHKAAYTRGRLARAFEEAGFERSGIELGLFELGMNIWARAVKRR